MSEKKQVGGLAVAIIPLKVRFAQAVGSGRRCERIGWKALLPDLPQEVQQRYLTEGTPRTSRIGCRVNSGINRRLLEQNYQEFAKGVLDGGQGPRLPDEMAWEDWDMMSINLRAILEDIGKSTGMIQDVVPLDGHCWKIGQVRVARRMDTHPTVRFVDAPAECAEKLAEFAQGTYPGGIVVPCKEGLSKRDFILLRRHGFAIFGLVEDCVLEEGRIVARSPVDWVTRLEPQIDPRELRDARSPPGLVKRRSPADETAKSDGIVTRWYPLDDTAKNEPENGAEACATVRLHTKAGLGMGKKERAGGPEVTRIPLDVRFARATVWTYGGTRVEWNTLLPDLPQEAQRRYLREFVPLARGSGRLPQLYPRYQSFAETVLSGAPVPRLPDSPTAEEMQHLRINHRELLADIAESIGMFVDVRGLAMRCWRIGWVQVAPGITQLAIGFVGKPTSCAEVLADFAKGTYPGGIVVPCKADLSERDFSMLTRHRFAIFGMAEDCSVQGGRIVARAPGAWAVELEKQVRPEELSAARTAQGLVTWRPPLDDTAKTETENGATACGPTKEAEGDNFANAVPHVAGAQTAAAPDTDSQSEHLVCGRLKVIEPGRSLIYGPRRYFIGGEQQWKLIRELIAGDGDYVKLSSKNPKAVFSKGDAKDFCMAAVRAVGIGRRGKGTYMLVK